MKKGNPCFIRVNPWLLLLPYVANTVPKPPRRHHLLLRVELDALFPLNVQITVERFVPAGEWEHRHRGGDADVDADHAGFDPMLELARGFSGMGEDRRAIAVG